MSVRFLRRSSVVSVHVDRADLRSDANVASDRDRFHHSNLLSQTCQAKRAASIKIWK